MSRESTCHRRLLKLTPASFLLVTIAQADSLRSRCGYSPQPDTAPESYFHCVFSQRQGYIRIYNGEKTLNDFSPDGEAPGTYVDKEGQRVYRIRGLAQSAHLDHYRAGAFP